MENLIMSGTYKAKDLKKFTPLQHILQLAEPLNKIDFQPNERLDVQASNIKNILTNALDVAGYRDLQKEPEIPEHSLRVMYNEMAQTQLEKKMLEMRGRKFEIDYDDAPGYDS